VPVWGFAEVVDSAVAELPVGSRVYGYLPMASHLRVEPAKATARGFVDGSARRADLPGVYNAYEVVPQRSADEEAIWALLQPLLVTSFLIADFLADSGVFGTNRVVVSSASSKTALGFGLCLDELVPTAERVGLTSPSNVAFTTNAGCWTRVLSYDRLVDLDPAVPTVFVDMAGSVDVTTKVHTHLGGALKYSCRVGATHWTNVAGRLDLPGPRPQFFFAPSRIEKRRADWGAGGLQKRFAAIWPVLAAAGGRWLTVDARKGETAIAEAWRDTVAGRVPPSVGLMLAP
jgi:hypothetical protein